LLIIGTASKSKVSSVFAGWEAGLLEVAGDAAVGALGDLVLGKGGEEAGGGPALLIGTGGELRPNELDSGQAEVVERQRQPAGVDRRRGGHAASPRRMVAISS
jgi:hypothetical protein